MEKKSQEPLTKTETEKFVNYYLSQESLWNISHKSYSKRDIRQAAMAMIAQQMQESCGRVMTVDQVSAKIASLRTYYGRELKKVNGSQKSGAASSDVYVSQWDFFQILDPLLRSQVQKRSSVSNMFVADKDTPEPGTTAECNSPSADTIANLPTKRKLDVLKMDVETDEWETLINMVDSGLLPDIKQFLIQWHLYTMYPSKGRYSEYHHAYESMRNAGFRSYYKLLHHKTYSDNSITLQADVNYLNTSYQH